MKKKDVKIVSSIRFLLRKFGITFVSLVLITLFVTGYFLIPAFGASEEVLNGSGALDTVEQVDSWSLTNNIGTSFWKFDGENQYSGAGSGKLQSPTGSSVDFDSYVYYRFTTNKVPVDAVLKLAYKKQYEGVQPNAGDWQVNAEIWKVGGTEPLETIPIDNGVENVSFQSFTKDQITSMKEMNGQYEVRLVQRGRTGQSESSNVAVWIDQVELTIQYDSTPPQIVSASANTDTTVSLDFNEPLSKASAENIDNYSISPALDIIDANLSTNGKAVLLRTGKQEKGVYYTVTTKNIQDISLNTADIQTANFEGIDTTPPEISQVKPVADNKVNVQFNEKIANVSAENKSNYQISPLLNILEASLLADGQTVQLVTDTQKLGTVYSVVINQISDLDGNMITSETASNFTGVDTTPPGIEGITVKDDTTLDVKFSEVLDPNRVTDINNYSISPLLDIKGIELLPDQVTLRLKTSAKIWQTNYTLSVKNVSDVSGNSITNVISADFKGNDTTVPKLISAKAVNDTTVEVVFSEAVEAASSQTSDNYSVVPELPVQRAVIQADGKTVLLTTGIQSYKTDYSINAKGISDLAGNIIESSNGITFSGADSTPPEIVSAYAVDYNTVNVIFNERVASLEAQSIGSYKIIDSLNNEILAVKSSVVQPDGVTVKLETGPQDGGAAYILTASGIKDLAGNIVNGEKSISFAGISPPVIESPKVLSASAPDNSTVVVTFGVTMDPVTAQNVYNYQITPDLPVTSALLQKDGLTVRLATSTQTGGTVYTVTVSNAQDQYGNVVDNVSNTAVFTGNAKVTENPHGRYLSDTNQCSYCHVTHNSPGANLISESDQTQLCFLCHDAGGQSQFDVADEFGAANSDSASHHNVMDGSMQCSDCHNPHDGGQDTEGNNVHLIRLLQSKADNTITGGNDFCFSCHKEAVGETDAINPVTYPADGVGHNNASYVIDGQTPFNPASGSGIRCLGCHEQHASTEERLLNENSSCFKCHREASGDNRYPGQSKYDNIIDNPHARTSSSKTNVSYPGVENKAGQCVNCHDPHGTSYGTSKTAMKTLRAPYNDEKNTYAASDFALCFGCHNNTSQNTKYDIQSSYNASEGGHTIKSSGGTLTAGSKMPCETCHTLHGTENNNKYMLKGELGTNLGDGRNECLACHKDGKVVLGISMTPPPESVIEHTESDKSCLSCHGTVHNPS